MNTTATTKKASTKSVGSATPKVVYERGNRRKLIGKVVNNTNNEGRAKKTIIVEVLRRFKDPVYGKYVKESKKYAAHDEKEEFKTNDIVEVMESRPYSATKRFVAVRLVERPEEV